MNVERSSGVILRTRLLTETSLIVHWLTAEHGRIATVAKGARRPKSPLRGKLDLYYEAEFSFQRSQRSDLHLLREVLVTQTHSALRLRFENLRQAAYATTLLELGTESETPIPGFHQLFRELLDCLGTNPGAPNLVLAFELKLLTESGLQPNFADTGLSPGTCRIAEALATKPLTDANHTASNPQQTNELDRYLQRFLVRHLERLPRGRAEAVGIPHGYP